MLQELIFNRGMITRLKCWKSDLQYQKSYLTLKVDDLEESAKTTLEFIHNMGLSIEQPEVTVLSPEQKFKRAINMVVAIFRMKKMVQDWHYVIQDSRRAFFEQEEIFDRSPVNKQAIKNDTFIPYLRGN